MSSTLTKNIVLSQHKAGANSEGSSPMLLTYETFREEDETILKIELPGVDPSTVDVSSEGNVLRVECSKGVLNHTMDIATNVSSIRADIQWGLLTLKIPNPPAPKTHAIKVSVHDAVKSSASKAPAKFTDED